MNNETLFKLYYVAWQQKNNIKEYPEFEGVDTQIDNIKTSLNEIEDINDIKHYFNNTLYLDIWTDLCLKDEEYFLKKSLSYIYTTISDIVDTLYYICSKDLEDYINYNKEDFIPIFNDDKFEIVRYEINNNLKIKNILSIIKKIDIEKYNYIKKEIGIRLDVKIDSINYIKELWNTIYIKEDGKVDFNNDSFKKLEMLIINHPNIVVDYKEEINDYYMLLKLSKVKNIEKIEELFFK